MTLLTDAEMADIRREIEALFSDTAEIRRPTSAPDAGGGQTETWASVATVPCRVAKRDLTPREALLAARLGVTTTWTITLPALTDVTEADRLVVFGHTYEVLAVLAPHSIELTRACVCVEIR